MRTPVAVGLALVCAGAPAAAQQSLLLRLSTPEGVRVSRLFQLHTRVTSEEPATGARAVREFARLGRVSQVVVGRSGGKVVVHLAVDSLAVRVREGGSSWRESAVGRLDTLWLQVRLDDRLQVAERAGSAGGAVAALLEALVAGVPSLVLPERSVRRGVRWQGVFEVPLAGVLPADDDVAAEQLRIRGTMAVDSVVTRARDTLAYLGLEGVVMSRAAAPGSGQQLGYSGRVAGSLVWSSGWGGWVAAATRFELIVEARRQGSVTPSGRRTIETTLRHAVVP